MRRIVATQYLYLNVGAATLPGGIGNADGKALCSRLPLGQRVGSCMVEGVGPVTVLVEAEGAVATFECTAVVATLDLSVLRIADIRITAGNAAFGAGSAGLVFGYLAAERG